MNNHFLKLTTFSLMLLCASPAFALDLHDARSQNLVGERADGYTAALNPSAKSLVDEVNAKRKAEYTRIGAQKGQSADVVAKIAAQEIINGLPAGTSYQGANGAWMKK
jgi:uncharacterized protein YdbL (DUF1318 family)